MMRISKLKVQGLRSLKKVDITLQNYTILIGRNNSGKSNVLLALKWLLDGPPRDLKESDFYKAGDKRESEIVIEATFEGVDQYLSLCAAQHRDKIQNCLENGQLIIQRTIRLGEKSELKLWQPRKGEWGLPTGIENALRQILPEVIFIETFKDPTDEAQAKGRAILAQLLNQIIQQAVQTDQNLKENLKAAWDLITSHFKRETGGISRVEKKIKTHMQNVFRNADVRLNFSLIGIDALLEHIALECRDNKGGPWTPLEGKGQGFQRMLYFALLQTLAEERRSAAETEGGAQQEGQVRPFLLLFEEPELFLHPALQREMDNVLAAISENNQVIISTHSPLFVTPQNIQGVLILQQAQEPSGLQTLCLTDPLVTSQSMDKELRRLFTLSKSADFLFADCVLVVEGETDRLLFTACWDAIRQKIGEKSPLLSIVDSGSKGVIYRWLRYLWAFGMKARGVVDIDFLLGDTFPNYFKNKEGEKDASSDEQRELDNLLTKWKDFKQKVNNVGKWQKARKGKFLERIKESNEINSLFEEIRQKCQEVLGIWVLSQGEIEDYFPLNMDIQDICQEIREGKKDVPKEIEQILRWVIGDWEHGKRVTLETVVRKLSTLTMAYFKI